MNGSTNKADYLDYLDYQEELEQGTYRKPRNKPKQSRAETISELVETGDGRESFNPSFSASRHERAWILSYLGGFYEDHVISDVLRQVKGGKEATVYCCRAFPGIGVDLIAAKVYRPRMFRTMRNDTMYRRGRDILDDGGNRGRREFLAMKKRTGFGQELLHSSWLGNEFATMQMLYNAGVSVPRPFTFSDNAILMEYVGEKDWPAPLLHSVRLSREEAGPLFDRLIGDVRTMLTLGRVHGDLSAHNILYWEGDVKIIDFPQAVDPGVNPEAYALLERDVTRLCQYFSHFGIGADPSSLTKDLWSEYEPVEYEAAE